MKKVGVFICNYNKAEFVVDCVRAVENQTFKNLDIYVVDNASTDDSVALLEQTFGNRIRIIKNPVNIGGSGGFNTGIKKAIETGYKYVMLVDNDAMLDKHAVQYLYEYLESHEDVGFCGAETLNMQHPEIYQDLGGRIDYDIYYMRGIMSRMSELPGTVIMETDYVASCALLCRTDVVLQTGGMPEENFIYWDDIEMCTKCRMKGYKVVVDSRARAYHDMSGGGFDNMFLAYYTSRNRFKFFTKFLPERELDRFYDTVTRETFIKMYGALPKKKYGTAFTAWNALDDFMWGRMGKAEDGKIVPYEPGTNKLKEYLEKCNTVLIYMPCHNARYYEVLKSIMYYFKKVNEQMEIMVTFCIEDYDASEYDGVFQLCEHVTQIGENILPRIYIDKHNNWVSNEKEYYYFKNFEKALQNFQTMYRDLFEDRKKELRNQ